MIRSTLAGAALLGCAACLPGSASAQNFNGTCPNVWRTGPILNATCLNAYGGLVTSSIDVRTCPPGAIGNANGQLACTAGYGGGGYGRGYGGDGYGYRRHHRDWEDE